MTTPTFTAAVYGATGYIGAEVLRRLLIHPRVELRRVCAADHQGQLLASAQPHLEGWSKLRYEAIPERETEPVDVLFLALPHPVSWKVVAQLRHTSTRIIDCSGAFRLKSPDAYQAFYGEAHPMPDLLSEFTYGLPEVNAARIRESQFVASPGCFATCIELGLLPLATQGQLTGNISTVGITGSSGAGSVALATTHHPSRASNLRVYKPLAHPHVPEIEALLEQAGAYAPHVQFVPVASPLVRGILATSTLSAKRTYSQLELDELVDRQYAQARFTRRPQGRLPEVVAVAGSNFAEVAIVAGPETPHGQTLTCVSTLDNLVKGGAGQAIQNMNLMLGLDETMALWDPGGYP
jgi:N-acetyl-gamma-glutamyl-phosphate/LysW-gamma-L-alpha-aminoadipyl-6-phosphate reductase